MTAPSGDSETEIDPEFVAEDGYSGVGALLRASRERLGESLPDVARMLRIRYPYMEAIESGSFDRLPGATYTAGFIRAYSDHLGLDSEEIIRRYKTESADGVGKPDLSFPTPVPETGIPGGAFVFIGLVVCALAYTGWYLSTNEDDFFADIVSPIPDRLSGLIDNNDKPDAAVTEPSEPASPTASENTEQTSSQTIASAAESASGEQSQPLSSGVDNAVTEAVTDAVTEAANTAQSSDAVAETEQVADAVVDNAQEVASAAIGEGTGTESSPEPSVSAEPITTDAVEAVTEAAAVSVENSVTEPVAETASTTVEASAEPVVAKLENTEPEAVTPSAVASTEEAAPNVEETEPEVNAPTPTVAPEENPVVAQVETVVTVPETAPTPESTTSASTTSASRETNDTNTATSAEEPSTVSEAAEPAPQTVEQAETEPAPEPVPETGSEAEPVAEPEPEVAAIAPADSEEDAAEAGEEDPQAEEDTVTAPAATAPAGADARIVIKAVGDSWIQVRDDINAEMLVTRLLQAGQSYDVPNREGLVLLTGNAGALSIVVDGTEAPSIGGPGVVRRGVALDPEKLKSGTAVSQ
jgi:cytoskeleton protein RodZ